LEGDVVKRLDPVTGPLSREEFAALVAAPYGAAANAIRKHDPLYGIKEDGEPIKWEVYATRRATEEGYAEVAASSIEEALELAGKLKSSAFSWDCGHVYDDAPNIQEVTPKRGDV
jgi:hypothetical protein